MHKRKDLYEPTAEVLGLIMVHMHDKNDKPGIKLYDKVIKSQLKNFFRQGDFERSVSVCWPCVDPLCCLCWLLQAAERDAKDWRQRGALQHWQAVFRPRGCQRSLRYPHFASCFALVHVCCCSAIPVRLHGSYIHKALRIILWGFNNIDDVYLKLQPWAARVLEDRDSTAQGLLLQVCLCACVLACYLNYV